MISFEYPELFLLAIPLWIAYRRWGRARGVTGWLRLAVALLLLLALTGPEFNLGGRGIDIIVVADRSRSMPVEAHASIRELIQNLDGNRGSQNSVGIITFGSQAENERTLSTTAVLDEYTKQVNPDGSDLNEAILQALNIIDPRRPARILVFSDGEFNGASPLSAARRARESGVPVDFRLYERQHIGDVAIESVLLPESVSPREPFQFSAMIYSDTESRGTLKVLRDGKQIASAEHDFSAGMNRVLFRDLLDGAGMFNYTVELDAPGDPLVENNRGAGIVRVDAGQKLLVLNADGADDNLVRAMRSGRLDVDVAAAETHPLTQDSLDQYRAVVLENVPADNFGRLKMERLAQFVEDLGGGLMLTGGERSFGTGGYFKSPLDEVLPVSMEMREEHRKTRVAIAIALDRSGSMQVPVAGGKVKMDLANLGTAECVRLLSPMDMVAVIAVDSTPHVVQELTKVEDAEGIASRVLTIESMGGGIFVYEGLVAAGNELMKAGDYSTRHIILFSDAADSEEPGDYKNLLAEYEAAGITVSVIGLGTKSDVDSKLLEDVALLGRGNIMFTNDAEELPRLFTQDTMTIARNTFIKADKETQPNGIAGLLLPESKLMGELGSGGFPNVGGYNLSYLKEDATAAAISQDEYVAPWSAFWYRGLGRAVAVTLEVDGSNTGPFGSWESYNDFLITHGRWLLGSGEPNDVFVKLDRQGQDAVVTVELDPERGDRQRANPPTLLVVPPGQEREEPIKPDFVWTGPDTLEARFRMDRFGTYRTLVHEGGKEVKRGPAVTLPYSPEYVPRIGLPSGANTLAEVAKLSGGKQRTDVLEVFRDPPRTASTMSLLPWLFVAAILTLLLEIAGRRLSLWDRMADVVTAGAETEKVARPAWLPKLKFPARARKAPARHSTASRPSAEPPRHAEPPRAPAATQPAASGVDVYEQAKQRAKRRLK